MKASIKYGYGTAFQDNRVIIIKVEQCIQALKKNCEQNIVAALNDNVNVNHVSRISRISRQTLSAKYCQIINEKLVKEESPKDIDSKVSF